MTAAAPVLQTTDVAAWLRHDAALGFTTSAHDEEYGFAERVAVVLHVGRREDHDPGLTAAAVVLTVDDADALHREWSVAGDRRGARRDVAPVDTTYGLREGAHVDPDGNLLRSVSPLRRVRGS
jgi:hypothetical protein